MQSYSYIKKARYLKNYQIYCKFEDGMSGIFDISSYITKGVFTYLQDEEKARKFLIENGVLTWKQGELDIAPETVYHNATKKPLPAWMIK